MGKWYVVKDGEVYNVFPEEDLQKYGIEQDQIVKITNNMEYAFNLAEKLNRKTEEHSRNFCPPKGYYNESKTNTMKVTITESNLNRIISESIVKILKEGYFDNMGIHETMFGNNMNEKPEEPKHSEEDKEPKRSEEAGKEAATKRKRVISRLKSDKVDVAQYAYSLWPDKDEDSARSYFYKCLDGKKNDAGDVYNFSDDEINRLYSMLANETN